MKRLALSTALVLSVAGAAFGAYAVAREAIVLDRHPQNSIEEFDRIASGRAQVALSGYAKRYTLESCHYGLTAQLSLVRPAEEIGRLATACRTYAQSVAATMPTNSFAWLVLAVADRALGDMPAMNRALEMSQRAGPNEQWIAEIRVALGEDNIDRLTDRARAGHDHDLVTLANSPRGVRTIAGRYVANEAFRNRITEIVSKQPVEAQRRFIRSVWSTAEELGQ